MCVFINNIRGKHKEFGREKRGKRGGRLRRKTIAKLKYIKLMRE